MSENSHEVLAAISEGVRDAVVDALIGVNSDTILEAIREGVKEAFDQLWPSQIRDAIENGVMSAMERE
jgi:hypothetical protein